MPDVKDLQYLDRLPKGGASGLNALMNALDWVYKPPVGKLDKHFLHVSNLNPPIKFFKVNIRFIKIFI